MISPPPDGAADGGENRRSQTDRAESVIKLTGIVGGLIAVFSAIYQLWQGNVHDRRDLRWKQAEMARTIVKEMVADEGWVGFSIMDWDDAGREYLIDGRKVRLNAQSVYTMLAKDTTDDTDRFINDRLDRGFFLVSQLEQAVRSSLVQFEDVRFPLSWYAGERMCRHKKLFEEYMKANAAPETLLFFERMEEWRSCKA